ncbi:MAG TPA: hypothetical protein VKD91_00945 [Pyrinomonadaceae bacterium]|nr:hypothetical protein [Pyrinomonadaceae bacterium]
MPGAELHRYNSWLTQLLIAAAFMLLLAPAGYSQSQSPGSTAQTSPTDPVTKKSKEDNDPRFGTPENEARAKMILKDEKKKYDENLARAREVSEIACQLNESYVAKRTFSNDDGKRLERLEKLTKRIRNEAGGSESEADDESKDISPKTEETVKHLAEVAEELNKLVEKTPRNVISAAVIDQANRLILITQHLRANR